MKSRSSPYLTEEGKLTLDEARTLVKEFSFLMLTLIKEQAPIPPPSYQRAQARLKPTLHVDPLTLVKTLHLLALCHLAVRVAHRRCAAPLPAGPGGAPRTYNEASLLLIGLLRTLWRLLYQDMHDWLARWPALALACGLPMGKEGQIRIPSTSQQCKRRHAAGAPLLHESLFVLTVQQALRSRLMGACDLIIESAPILAWRRADPDATYGHPCSSSASSSSFARLPGAHAHLSRFWLTTLKRVPSKSVQFQYYMHSQCACID